MLKKLDDILARHKFLTEELGKSEVLADMDLWKAYSKEQAELTETAEKYEEYLKAQREMQDAFDFAETETDAEAVVTFLPIYENRVDKNTAMTISIRGKENKAPVAEDSALETYKNLPNEGMLKASDPEGQSMTYTVIRQPRRGTVEIREDGSFVYTPKKNKVGVDSFTYTATDPAGNVSREATVTIQIMKPTDAKQYTDTIGDDCRFSAEWLRNTGLFVSEQIGEDMCFQPQKLVSRGEFLTMLAKTLDIPAGDATTNAIPADTPLWLRPYLAAALRSGLTANLPQSETGSFNAYDPITGGEVAVMVQNVLDLPVSQQTLEAVVATEGTVKEEIPTWASPSLTAMADNGILLTADQTMTRSEVAQLLYQVYQLSQTAPGMTVIRMQQ